MKSRVQKDGYSQRHSNSPATPVSKSSGVSASSPLRSSSLTPKSVKSPSSPRSVLTGSRRVLNDTVVTIHSTVQAWKNLLLKGLQIIQEVQSHRDAEDLVQSSCEKLGVIVRQMKHLVRKLGEYSEQLSNLAILNASSTPPFLTWNYEDFSNLAKEIHASYQKESKLKMELAYNLHKCPSEQLNFCIVAWTHVIYLIEESKFDAMLIECALKK